MQVMNVLGKGQIVIPAEIRKRFNLKPGASVEIREVGDHLELYPLPDDPIAAFRGSLLAEKSLTDELIEEHRQEVARDGSV